MKKVIMYSTPVCSYCNQAKEYLKDYDDVELEVIDVTIDADKRQEAIDKSDQMGVPVFDIDGKIVAGFNKKEINKLLDIK